MIHVIARLEPWGESISLRMLKRDSVERITYYPQEIVWEEVKPLQEHTGQGISLATTEAQVLMDNLWNCGLRPTEGSGSAGSFSAVQAHLSDMRKIASKKLGIDL